MTTTITGPRVSWLLLIVYYVYNDTVSDLLESTVSHGLKESMSVRLLEYLLRAWNEDERPPTSLEALCDTLTAWLLPSTGSSTRAASHQDQVDSLLAWLRGYWDKLCDSDSIGPSVSAPPSVLPWLDLVLENASIVLAHLEMDGVPDPTETFIDRRSPIGMAVRRMRLAADSMCQIKAGKSLERQLIAWRDGEQEETDKSNRKLALPKQGALATRDDVFSVYKDARFRGDYSTVKECIHRFFNYAPSTVPRGLPPISRRKQLHHVALTALASFHLNHDELAAAREALKEAIQLARVEKDNQCLEICSSLSSRIDAAEYNHQEKRPTGPTTQPSRRGDAYWSALLAAHQGVKQYMVLVDLERQALVRPSQSFMAMTSASPGPHAGQQAKSAANLPTGEPPRQVISKSHVRPWVAMAHLASRMGDVQSAQRWRKLLREEPYHDKDDQRFSDELAMRVHESYELAEEGRYDEGLSTLVDRSIIKKMSIRQYHRWTLAIWKVLHLQAVRMGDLLTAKKIAQMATGKDTLPAQDGPVDLDYQARLAEAKELIASKEGIRAIPILESLFRDSESTCHFSMYRQSRILYAQVLALELGLVQDALEVLEEIMPEVLVDHNRERRAEASFIYAKVILATATASDGSKAASEEGLDRSTAERAMTWLERARQDLYVISSTSPTPALLPVLFSLARLHDHLGDVSTRDQVAQEYVSAAKKINALSSGVGLGNARRKEALDFRVWEDLIARVGKRISGLSF